MVILENYEANVRWFPLKWDMEKMPKLLLGSKNHIGDMYWISNENSSNEKKIDYVLVYGNTSKIDNEKYAELKTELETFYELDENSVDPSYVKLFRLK